MKKSLLLWVAIAFGLPSFAQTETWESFSDIKDGYDFATAPDGAVWLATDHGAYKYLDGTWTVYNTTNTPALTNNMFRSVFVDQAGHIWLGTYDTTSPSGMFKFDGTNWTQYTTSNSGLAFNHVFKTRQDAAGDLWFATYGGGVSRLGTDNEWTTFNVANTAGGLLDNTIFTLAISPNGDKWFSSYPTGAARLAGNTWTFYDMSFLPSNGKSVRGIAPDNQGGIWLSTFAGLARFSENTWTTFRTENSGLASNVTTSIYIDWKNNKWVGTSDKGVSKLEGTTWKTYNSTHTPILANSIRAITIDRSGRKWFATSQGVAVLTDEDALPLRLISFTGAAENALVTLSWITSQEENVYGFDVERSENGKDFTKLGFVEAGNDYNSTPHYRYNDTSAPGGNSYYRLRMRDYDGSFTLSPIVVVKSTRPRLLVYPNPSEGMLIVEHTGQTPLTSELFSLDGKILVTTQSNHLDTTPFAAGAYLLRVTNADGIRESHRVIIKK